jgi:hypothetical protein
MQQNMNEMSVINFSLRGSILKLDPISMACCLLILHKASPLKNAQAFRQFL